MQKSEEAGSQFPSVKKDFSGEKDFGVPSLSQATDRYSIVAMYGDSTSVVVIPLYAALVASRTMKTKAIHLKTGDQIVPLPVDVTFVVGIGRQLPQHCF